MCSIYIYTYIYIQRKRRKFCPGSKFPVISPGSLPKVRGLGSCLKIWGPGFCLRVQDPESCLRFGGPISLLCLYFTKKPCLVYPSYQNVSLLVFVSTLRNIIFPRRNAI